MNKNTRIKAIIFDYGGVLSKEVSFRPFSKAYALKFGVNPKEFHKIIKDNWIPALVDKISSKLFWQNLSDFLKTDNKTLRKDCMGFFGVRPEVLELIKKLKKNYKLGLLSNQIEDWLEEVIKEKKLNKVFDEIVTSYKSKIAKPDISIFKEIIKKLDTKATECIYIDDIEENISKAKELGMRPILFKNYKQLKEELKKLRVKF